MPSAARLGNCDVAPIARCSLGPENVKCYISMLLQLDHISFNLEPDGGIRNNASRRQSSALPGVYLHEDPRWKEGITFWRCQAHKSGYLARASSEGSSVIVRREHDHPPNNAMCTKEIVMSTMRKCAREESTSINRIYDDALQVSNSVMYTAKH